VGALCTTSSGLLVVGLLHPWLRVHLLAGCPWPSYDTGPFGARAQPWWDGYLVVVGIVAFAVAALASCELLPAGRRVHWVWIPTVLGVAAALLAIQRAAYERPLLCTATTSIGAGTWLTAWGAVAGLLALCTLLLGGFARSRRRARARREHELDAERGTVAARERARRLSSVLELLDQMRALLSEHVVPGDDEHGQEVAEGPGVASRRALNRRLQARLDSLGEPFDAASSARKVSLSDEWEPHDLDAAVAEVNAELARSTRDLSPSP